MNWVIWAIIAWLIFVVTLTLWWLIFSLRLIAQLRTILSAEVYVHHQNMLVTEGATLILCLIVGGVVLVYFALREQQRLAEVRHFFSTFSHDLKTSISRLVLQGERLFSSDKSADDSAGAKSFQKNLLALEMQLENSLHLAQQVGRRLTLQTVDLKSILSRVHGIWPDIKVSLVGSSHVYGDAVALESIIKNLVSNSVLHGGADEIHIKISDEGKLKTISYSDNGKVFEGSLTHLGRRPQPSQLSTGIGLYIVQQWCEKLKGRLDFSRTVKGSLQAVLTLPGDNR